MFARLQVHIHHKRWCVRVSIDLVSQQNLQNTAVKRMIYDGIFDRKMRTNLQDWLKKCIVKEKILIVSALRSACNVGRCSMHQNTVFFEIDKPKWKNSVRRWNLRAQRSVELRKGCDKRYQAKKRYQKEPFHSTKIRFFWNFQ